MIGITLFFIHIICYWTIVFLYDKNVPINDLKIAAYSSLKNQVLYTLPSTVIFFNNYPTNYEHFLSSFGYLPILIISSDCYFYITHRPMHCKWLYHMHKHHHTGSVCVAKSLDANALEHIVGNLGSFIIGILFLWYFGLIINIYIVGGWVGLVTINTCISHSNLQCLLDSGKHLNHHKYLNCNYGFGLYLMDRLGGTYK
jgi:sterol desaturase/sphingolipid hydroxylase (fatty acid hydroxylase superfamily)